MKLFVPIFLSTILTCLPLHMAAQEAVTTGGVGEMGREELDARKEGRNLKLVFVGEGGMYLADVMVTIRRNDGTEILKSTSDGPYLLANLKPGRYTVEAEAEGYSKKQVISVDRAMKTYHIRFPVKDAAPLPPTPRQQKVRTQTTTTIYEPQPQRP